LTVATLTTVHHHVLLLLLPTVLIAGVPSLFWDRSHKMFANRGAYRNNRGAG